MKKVVFEDYRACCFAITAGSLGGWIFYLLSLPLPWMLGSLTFTAIAAMMGLRLMIFKPVRSVTLVVLGCMLGAGFSPEIIEYIYRWFPSFGSLMIFAVIGSVAVTKYFQGIAGFDPVTAYFSSTPGGLTVMSIIGGSMGGDMKRIALAHALRIVLVVFILGFAFRFCTSVDMTTSNSVLSDNVSAGVDFFSVAFFGAGLGVAIAIAHFLRLPTPTFTGAMLGSAVIHITGVAALTPPRELVSAAQVILGSFIGCRFWGTTGNDLMEMGRISLGSTLLLLGIACCFSLVLSPLLDIPFTTLLLAFSPGGLAEMCLIGLALGADVAFISSHHLLRILLITAFAPTAFKLIGQRAE